MKNIFSILLLTTMLYSCKNNSNNSEAKFIQRFGLIDNQKYEQLKFESLEQGMETAFYFRDSKDSVSEYLFEYNHIGINDEKNIIDLLQKGKTYRMVYEIFDNKKLLDSLEKVGYRGDNIKASGKYVLYIADSAGSVIYIHKKMAKNLLKNIPLASKCESSFSEELFALKDENSLGHREVDFDLIASKGYLISRTFGSGFVSETYWDASSDSLRPVYHFEFGGFNNDCNYSLTFIPSKIKKEGTVAILNFTDGGYNEQYEVVALKNSFISEASNNQQGVAYNQKSVTNSNSNNSTKLFSDVQLTLTDASLKKAKLYLGEPDKYEFGFGHETKGFAIYYDRVIDGNNSPQHLVLFLRMNGNQWGNSALIEEIYSVEDNQKVCFGIHCIKIKNRKIYTNALDLINSRGYEMY